VFRPKLITGPAELAVSVADAKGHLRVGHSSEDVVIGAFVGAAIAHLDGHSGILGRCLVTQAWRQDFPGWPEDGRLRLPFPDVDLESVVVTYLDTYADEQVLPEAQYEVLEDARGVYVEFRAAFTAPSLEDDRAAPVWVTFDAGYGVAADVPAAIKAAILLITADLYENRENTVISDARVQAMPIAADRLLTPYRRVGF
jgi:uncharacterized phiE125 gp8 family phage protein